MTPEELDALKAQLHPSVRATFVYLPDPKAATPDEIDAAFPCLRTNKSLFMNMWRDANRRQQAAQASASESAQPD